MAETGIPRSAQMFGDAAPVLRLELEARAENVSVVRHRLADCLAGTPLGGEDVCDVLLAVTEACANVVVHAYAEEVGTLEVVAWQRRGELQVVVRDRGSGMRPRVDSPGLGLGLPVMMALAASVAIRPAGGGGTEVALTFRIDRGDAA